MPKGPSPKSMSQSPCRKKNKARDRAMHERMEQIERQMKTLTTILPELRDTKEELVEEVWGVIKMSHNLKMEQIEVSGIYE